MTTLAPPAAGPVVSDTGGRYRVDEPGPGDAAAIAALLALPMPGRISLSLQPGADAFTTAAADRSLKRWVVVRDSETGEAVACGSRSVSVLWINGEPTRVGYLGGLRKRPGVRLPRRLIAAAFNRLLDDRQVDEADFDLTSIMADNTTARRGLERGVPGLPMYTPVGGLLTVTFRTKLRRSCRSRDVQPLPLADVLPLLHEHDRRYHGRPVWRVGDEVDAEAWCITRDGGPAVVAALSDQRQHKRIVVDDLSPSLAWSRGVLNPTLRLIGRPTIPRRGAVLPTAFVSHLASTPRHGENLLEIINAVARAAAQRGIGLLSVGLPDAPDSRRLARRLRGWVSRSVIYAVHRGPAPALDGRPVWPEVATL